MVGSPKMWRHGMCKDSNKFYKIEEKLDMDLFDWLVSKPVLIPNSLELVEYFKLKFTEVIEQVLDLHEQGYGHFDIKPENIMVKFIADGSDIQHFRLIDYGFTEPIPASNMAGTPGYYDPVTFPKTEKTDVFAIGITLFACLFGRNIIEDQSMIEPMGVKINTLPVSTETPNEWIERIYIASNWSGDKAYRIRQLSLLKQYPILLHLLYSMLLITPRRRGGYSSRKRYNLNQVLSHSFWIILLVDELEEWSNTPEYEDRKTTKKIHAKTKNDKLRDVRNNNRLNYGTSKRGDDCVCTGLCEYKTLCSRITGMCSNTKKCQVNPIDCGGKKLDKC